MTALYNDIDTHQTARLRGCLGDGLIAKGRIDENKAKIR